MKLQEETSRRNGAFVVLEGIDGAGTTTQAERYAAHLRSQNRRVHVTREPSNGPIGSLIRLMLRRRVTLPSQREAETMALLFAADRLDHVEAEVMPLLRDGVVVISDRYDLSSVVYQAATSGTRGPDGAEIIQWIRTLNQHARRPDVVVVVDVPADVAETRRCARGGVAELFEEAELQARLAAIYRTAEQWMPDDRIVHVDGSASVAAVGEAIAAVLDPLLGVGARTL